MISGKLRSLGLFCLVIIIILALLSWAKNPFLDLFTFRERQPNILFIAIDTLSSRFVGAYGAKGGQTPNIDRLALNAAQFNNSYATSSWTKTSFASLLTSKNPQNHQVLLDEDALAPENITLTEELLQLNYTTSAVTSQQYFRTKHGFSQGFQDYINIENDPTKTSSSIEVSDQVIKYLNQHIERNQDKESPFFIFAHYFDPHVFYLDHEEFDFTDNYHGKLSDPIHPRRLPKPWKQTLSKEDIEYLINLHREEIAFTDLQIGRVLSQLNKLGLYSNTIVVITSDHGEEFLEHDEFDHWNNLYEETVRVPLIISYPGTILPGLYKQIVSSIDVMPTLLELANLRKVRSFWEGRSLMQTLTSGIEPSESPPIILEVKDRNKWFVAMIEKNYKFIWNKISGDYELFELSSDPNERNNLAHANTDLIRHFKQKFKDYGNTVSKFNNKSSKVNFDSEEIKILRSLGYLN